MADNQDKLTQHDQQMLDELEKQLSSTSAKSSANPAAGKTPAGADVKSASAAPFSKREEYISQRTPAPARAKTGMLWFVSIINLLLILSLAGGAYWAWLLWQNQQTQQSELMARQQADFQAQQANLARSLADNQLVKNNWLEQYEALQSSQNELSQHMQATRQQVVMNQAKLDDIADRRPADWLLAEADYLLKMAGRKLWLEHDINTAMLMLQATDTRLQELADPALLPIREKLAIDMQNLQQINPVSTTTLALTLSAMQQQVNALPLAFFKRPQDDSAEQTLSDSPDDWQSNLMKNIREALDGFFSIKKVNSEVKPFMSEQQQWLAREQLKFTLQTAQIAALKENAELYQSALHSAQSMLAENFDAQKPAVSQFNLSLDTLLATDIDKVYPPQFSATEPLQNIINQRLDNRFTDGAQ